MKNALNYPELWQQKRNELPVEGDPVNDWLEMQIMLDAVMPVIIPVKKPYNPKGLKGLYKLLIGFSTAVVIYGGVQLYRHQKQIGLQNNEIQKNIPQAPTPIEDSVTALPAPLQTPVMNNQPVKGLAPVPRIAVQRGKKADSIGKQTTIKTDNRIIHRDSALEQVAPGLLKPDSAVKTLPGALNIKPHALTPGNNTSPKKKKRKFQIGV